jgi:hypothetical protein
MMPTLKKVPHQFLLLKFEILPKIRFQFILYHFKLENQTILNLLDQI